MPIPTELVGSLPRPLKLQEAFARDIAMQRITARVEGGGWPPSSSGSSDGTAVRVVVASAMRAAHPSSTCGSPPRRLVRAPRVEDATKAASDALDAVKDDSRVPDAAQKALADAQQQLDTATP